MSFAEHGQEIDQAVLLARIIRRSDPERRNAFTPERADEFLAEEAVLKTKISVNMVNVDVTSNKE